MTRLVFREDSAVVVDKCGSAPGRGAYVCNDARCIELLEDKRRLVRVFRRKRRKRAEG